MSILEYPEADTTNNSTRALHVWNNAAFDGEELQGFSFPMKKTCSWSTLHHSDSDCSKENVSPAAQNSSLSAALKPSKKNEKAIDDEIEEIENEIKRLSTRLEALRLEKAAKAAEKRGRVVAAKFMEPKVKKKKIEETPKAEKVNLMRRGVSLGPAEIAAAGGGRSRKADVVVTPVPETQSRRKSCFWKLQDVNEVKGISERRKSLTVSAGPAKIAGRVSSIQGQSQRQAATTTLGSRKCVKKEDGLVALVQPRKLFREGEKSLPNSSKKPGRVVASRYNQIGNQSSGNSFAIDYKKKPASSVRVKKRWEIPAEVEVSKSEEDELKLSSIADMSDVLLPPKIRMLRCTNESPRDSGAAKRVSELTGKRSYFCPDVDVEASVCQVLSFAEEDAGQQE